MDLRSPSSPSSSSPPASAWTSAASVLVGGNSNPTFWVVSWVMINISLTLLNKSVFQFVHFQYPFTLSACHMLCLYLFCFLIYRVLHLAPQDQISTTTRNRIYMLSLLFTLNICAGNAGLMFSSVSLREVVRSLTPVITMGFSIWLLGKTYGSSVIWSLVPITFGVGITTYTELEFHFWGFVILLVGCALAALKGVLSNILLVGTHSVTPLYLLFFIAPLAFLQMVFLAYLLGEIDQIILNWEDVSQPLTILMITSTAILAFFLNVTNFHLNKVTSPLTVSVAGSFKEVVTIGMSFMVFKNKVTGLNLLGIAIALSGTFLYHYNSAHSKQPTTTKNKMDKETSDASLREEGHTTRRKDSLAQFELEEK